MVKVTKRLESLLVQASEYGITFEVSDAGEVFVTSPIGVSLSIHEQIESTRRELRSFLLLQRTLSPEREAAAKQLAASYQRETGHDLRLREDGALMLPQPYDLSETLAQLLERQGGLIVTYLGQQSAQH